MNRISSIFTRTSRQQQHLLKGCYLSIWKQPPIRSLSELTKKPKDEIRVEEWENKDFILKNQLLLKLMGYYSKSSILARGAMSLHRAAKFGALRKAFYTRGEVVDDFRSQQVLMTAHVWTIHKRLIKEGKDGKLVQEILFDEFWMDTTYRIRSFKFPEITINKHLRSVQEYCFGALISFDYAVSFEKEEEIRKEMCEAVRAHIYNHSETVKNDKVEAVADYLLSEMRSLQNIDVEPFLHGRIRWDEVPSFGAKNLVEEEETEILGQVGRWRKELCGEGKEYYWNMDTYESTFTKPPGM